jgi:hypothetical protein
MKSIFKLSMVKPIVCFSVLLAVTFACRRDKVDVLGPAYIMAPEGFSVTGFTTSADTVDFAATSAVYPDGPVLFSATFTHSVSWVLTIRGQKSGALHKIQGISNGLSNVSWSGIHDELAFFRKGENATATLSFFGTELTSSVDININTAPNYRTCGIMHRSADMEGTVIFPNWEIINQPGVTLSTAADVVDYSGNLIPSIQGDRYFQIKGQNTSNNIFVGGLKYTGNYAAGANSLPLSTDPNEVWINIYVYGTGDVNTTLNVELQEDDAGSPVGYQATSDDAYIASIKPTHTGWKLFSFKYSTIPVSSSAPNGGSGNKIQEPALLKYVVMAVLKEAAYDAPVEVYFDYPIITIGGPFKPCK